MWFLIQGTGENLIELDWMIQSLPSEMMNLIFCKPCYVSIGLSLLTIEQSILITLLSAKYKLAGTIYIL